MHNRLIKVMVAFLLLLAAPHSVRAEDSERMQTLEELMEIAVDRFQLNRYIEARAALNMLIAEDPSDEEAFLLRKLFGEKVMLEMQRYGDRPSLSTAERQVLMLLGEAGFALSMRSPEKAADRIEKIIEAFKTNGYAEDTFEVKRAEALLEDVKSLGADNLPELAKVSERVTGWKEELQSIGNAPLLLLNRAQRYEQAQLRSPATVARLVKLAVSSPEGAQRYLLEIDRLGAYAVPELVGYLRDKKNNEFSTNAHFVLLSLGKQVVLPLCEVLKTDDQLLLQQVCSILGDMRPADRRALPYLKEVFENQANLESTRTTARRALENITGKKAEGLFSAADYFMGEANRYYLGGAEIDREITEMNNTVWIWDPQMETATGLGALRQLEVPEFILSDVIAEEKAYRGMALAAEKVPFQVLLASIFFQQERRVDVVRKLLSREDMSFNNAEELRKQATEWDNRLAKNVRIAYALGSGYMAAVLKKAMVDNKADVAIAALDAITELCGENGWQKLQEARMVDGGLSRPASGSVAPAKSGTGSSGDEAVTDAVVETVTVSEEEEAIPEVAPLPAQSAPVAPATPVTSATPAAPAAPTATPAPAVASGAASDTVISALDSSNPRIAVAAANSLVRIGLPITNPAYNKLMPLLVEGAQENRATVALVISNNDVIRNRFVRELEKGRVIPLSTSEGYAGYNLATQYPPKDAIFIDNSLDQFDLLKLQLEMRKVSHGKVLPLTIITTRDHATRIARQFSAEAIEAEAREQHATEEQVVNQANNIFDNMPWRVVVRHNISAEATSIFEDLTNLSKMGSDYQSIVVLTNPSREERYKLKEALMIRAERELRPAGLTEYSRIRNQDRVLGDIFGVRSTYVPVFVDEELAGYDAMKTVQTLQTDPRTRPVPIAIMTDEDRVKNVEADFEFFIKEGKVRIVSREIDTGRLTTVVNEMKNSNELSQKNYARALSNDIAVRSAEALNMLNENRALSTEEQRALVEIVADPTRPEELRIEAANALGHFKANIVLRRLMNLFEEIGIENTNLRAAVLLAIGKIDTGNEQMEFKLKAMNDPKIEIQRIAARILGPAAQDSEQIKHYLNILRPNDPLKLVKGEVVVSEVEAEKGENGEAAPAEVKEGEKVEDEAPAEKKKEETVEDVFNW